MTAATGGWGWGEGSPSSSCVSHQWLLSQRSLAPRAGSPYQIAMSCNELMCYWMYTLVLRSQSHMGTYHATHHWALWGAKRGLLKAEVFPVWIFFRVRAERFQNSCCCAACTLFSEGLVKESECHSSYFVGRLICGERCCDLPNTCSSRAGGNCAPTLLPYAPGSLWSKFYIRYKLLRSPRPHTGVSPINAASGMLRDRVSLYPLQADEVCSGRHNSLAAMCGGKGGKSAH